MPLIFPQIYSGINVRAVASRYFTGTFQIEMLLSYLRLVIKNYKYRAVVSRYFTGTFQIEMSLLYLRLVIYNYYYYYNVFYWIFQVKQKSQTGKD